MIGRHGDRMTADEADGAGLGLMYGTVRLAPTRAEWPRVAARLITEIRDALGDDALDAAHIGSTTAVGMLAKPIVDLAVRLSSTASLPSLIDRLQALGYRYRGDGGADGGQVFVLEVRPRYRVAHVHVVLDGDPQWERYLTLVDRLRRDARTRAAYEAVKRELASIHTDDHRAYTTGKHEIVGRLVAAPAVPDTGC